MQQIFLQTGIRKDSRRIGEKQVSPACRMLVNVLPKHGNSSSSIGFAIQFFMSNDNLQRKRKPGVFQRLLYKNHLQ
jgi:hypothetical protein